MGIFDWITGKRRKERPAKKKTLSSDDTEKREDMTSERMKIILEELEKERKRNRMQEKKIKEIRTKFNDLHTKWKAAASSQEDEDTDKAISDHDERTESKVDGSKIKEIDSGNAPKGRKFERFSSPILPGKVFSNFVVDDSNRFPYLASEAVATNEGRKYNPLFIYGPVGVGKTHLLHAIANRMKENEKDISILYSSTEKFTEVLIDSLKKDDISAFRKMYRDVDVLLIDDIQMLSGREATQKEFFHMFNHLYNSGKQIVLCSDRPPGEIKELESRLRSRFEGGLIIDIQVPTFEGRRQILINLSQREGFSLSSEVLDYLSLYLDSSVRELEGGFNRVTAYASLMKEPVTVSLIRKVLVGTLNKKNITENDEVINVYDELVTPASKEEEPSNGKVFKDLDLEEETDMIEKELLMELKKNSMSK